jgi:hypothetical protein
MRFISLGVLIAGFVLAPLTFSGPALSGPTGSVTGEIVVTKDGEPQADRSRVVVYLDGLGGTPSSRKAIRQKDQTFSPDLTVVVKGETVDFPNDDKIFHNVFSLSETSKFDLGLYKSGRHGGQGQGRRQQLFRAHRPGRPVSNRSRAPRKIPHRRVAHVRRRGTWRGGDHPRRNGCRHPLGRATLAREEPRAKGRNAIRTLQMTVALLGLAAAACKRPSTAESPSARDSGGSAEPNADMPTSPPLALYPATRCAECHGKIANDWRTSAHARADASPAYTAMRSNADGASCDRCHAPLAVAGAGSLAANDAVGCDACHTIRDVDSPGRLTMHLDDAVKYGPLCDAKSNYFHRVGCSPLHGTSELCSACHSLEWPTAAGDKITVQSEFEEWRASTYGASNVECQSCHMPGSRAAMAVAVGSTKRKGVSHHGFSMAELRGRAVSMTVTLRDAGPKLAVQIVLRNVRAGHSVPTGLPERRLLLRVEVQGGANPEGHREERAYGRILVDESGPAPFYTATRLATDSRIGPEESRDEAFELDAPDAGVVEVSLSRVDIAPEIAKRLGILPENVVVHRVRVPFGPRPKKGPRGRLPRTVSVGR